MRFFPISCNLDRDATKRIKIADLLRHKFLPIEVQVVHVQPGNAPDALPICSNLDFKIVVQSSQNFTVAGLKVFEVRQVFTNTGLTRKRFSHTY